MRVPDYLLPHTVTVRPQAGESSVGTLYGEPFTLRCMARGGIRMVRDADGNETTSTLTLYAAPGDYDRVTAGSQVVWRDTTTTVLNTILHDSGGLGAPDHTEVVCE